MTTISFKCDSSQRQAIEAAAREMGMTPGQFARFSSLQCVWLGAVVAELSDLRKAVENSRDMIIEDHKSHIRKAVEFLAKKGA